MMIKDDHWTYLCGLTSVPRCPRSSRPSATDPLQQVLINLKIRGIHGANHGSASPVGDLIAAGRGGSGPWDGAGIG
jgi:hypothetical protein